MSHEQNVKNVTPSWASNGNQTGYTGVFLTIGNSDVTLNSVTKYSSQTATTCYVGTTPQGSEVGSQAYVSDTATFATPLTLSANTKYYITNGSGGAAFADFWEDTDEYNQPNIFKWNGRVDQIPNAIHGNGIGGGIVSINFDGYLAERSAGRLKIGEGLWGKNKSNLFSKQTAEGESKIETAGGRENQIMKVNSSYNSSSLEIEVTDGNYANMITVRHKSNTGKVVVIAQAPVLVKAANGDVTMRLTKAGTEITGSENQNIWSSGDGIINVALMAFTDVEIGQIKTYALQWKEGDAALDFASGGTNGAYNIFVQDIQ